VKSRRLIASLVLLATVVFALGPLYREGDVTIPVHHVLHTVMIFGAALAAVLFTWPGATGSRGSAAWLILAVVAPVAAMFLMWPSDYSVFEGAPALHAAQHLGLASLGFLTGYSGQRYAAGIGVAMSASLILMGLLAAGGFGVSPGLQVH
jgi:hypothetical protein